MYRDWEDDLDGDFDDWGDQQEQRQWERQVRKMEREAIDNFFTNLTIVSLVLIFFGASSFGLWQLGRWAYGSIF